MIGRKIMRAAVIILVPALAVACHRRAEPIRDDLPVPWVSESPRTRPTSTWIHLRTFDRDTGAPLPAKVSVWRDGAPVPLARHFDPPHCEGTGASLHELAPGALGTWNGIALWRGDAVIPVDEYWVHRASSCNPKDARVGLAPGHYRFIASRGPEYQMAEAAIELAPGQGTLDFALPLVRAIDSTGYLAADLHIHTGDGSGDSSISAENRVKTEVAVGIEVMVSSDHDHHTDLSIPLHRLWPDPAHPAPAFAVIGNEVTTRAGHFNLMPVGLRPGKPGNGAVDPHALPDRPEKFLPVLHALPTHPLIQVNHPRLGYAAYFDSWACGEHGWQDTTVRPRCSLAFDSVEVMSGTLACGSLIRRQIDDWYALLRFGALSAGVGSSDTHHESGILAGFPRSFVRVDGGDGRGFSEAAFIAALRARRAIASTGPFVTMSVDRVHREGDRMSAIGGRVGVSARVQFPSWMDVSVLRLLVDGRPVRSWPVIGGADGKPGAFAIEDIPLTLARSGFVNVEVQGRRALPDWLVGDHVKTARAADGTRLCPNQDGSFGMIPFAVTNPVFVDVSPAQPSTR